MVKTMAAEELGVVSTTSNFTEKLIFSPVQLAVPLLVVI